MIWNSHQKCCQSWNLCGKSKTVAGLQMFSYRVNDNAFRKLIFGLIFKGDTNIFECPFPMCHYGLHIDSKKWRIITVHLHTYDIICVLATKKSITHKTFLWKKTKKRQMNLLMCQTLPEEDMDSNEKSHFCLSKGNIWRFSLQVEVSMWREVVWTQPSAVTVARWLLWLLEVSEMLRVRDGVRLKTQSKKNICSAL